MRLGIGELKLRKKRLLPKIELHFQTKEIYSEHLALYFLVRQRRKCPLKPSILQMNAIQQPNSFDRQRQDTQSKSMNLIGACDLCLARDQLPDQ